jgi:hypothetical protein
VEVHVKPRDDHILELQVRLASLTGWWKGAGIMERFVA